MSHMWMRHILPPTNDLLSRNTAYIWYVYMVFIHMIYAIHVIFSYVWHYSGTYHMCTGWRRLIGCLRLQVIFRKRATNLRALFWEMTYEDKASCDSTPPCIRPRMDWSHFKCHEQVDSLLFSVLPGSESSFTEITEYVYFSLIYVC